MTSEASAQVIVAGKNELTAQGSFTSTEKLVGDVPLAAGLTDEPVNVGVPDTANLKYLAIKNAGIADLTFKVDSGTIVVSLKGDPTGAGNGEALVLQGPGIAKAIIDELSNATTCDTLKVTTPAGPDTTTIQFVALIDAT